MRLIQISDTHVSATHGHFGNNVDAVRRWLDTQNADLIVNTGDLSMNGAIAAADLDAAARWHQALGAPVECVPGNHDVGDLASIRPDQEIGDQRLDRYRAMIGPDRWSRDIAGWRLIGLNAMLCGSGLAAETAQLDWLAAATATDAKIAVFLHKPFFIVTADEGPRGYWTVAPEPRRGLLDILGACDLRLIASGHLHIAQLREHGGIAHAWGPSGAFVCGGIQEDLGGARRIGALEHIFSADGVVSRYVRPPGVADTPLDPVIAEIYPPAEVAA